MKKIKQGQTRWLTVVYEPGKIEGYNEQYVAAVYPCFVTKVENNTVWYNTPSGPYLSHVNYFNKLHKTFRKALSDAKQQISDIDRR